MSDRGNQPLTVTSLIPYVHVANIERSIVFYQKLGFQTSDTFRGNGQLFWCSLRSGEARLMLALTESPIDPIQQAVLFYCYTENVTILREQLLRAGISVGPVAYPDYMPNGEIRIEDPDGYTLLIGQLER